MMFAAHYEQHKVFESSIQTMPHQLAPLQLKNVLLNQPMIGINDEESKNPVLKEVLYDLREAQLRFGASHQKCADAWNALGLIRIHMQRDPEGARECHEYALTIFRERNLSKEIATTLNDLGYCFERLGLPDAAMRSYQESLSILESECFPESHPQIISTRRAISRMQRR